MHFDFNRKFLVSSRSSVGIDWHPTEPWLLTGRRVTDTNIVNLKFIARKNWFVVVSLDHQVHVFNYNTHEKVVTFKAHSDTIRSLAVHPTSPIILTASDDYTMKVWDWDKQWHNIKTYQVNTFITHIAINPSDPSSFATADLHSTVKMWSIASPMPNFTIRAHNSSIYYVDFYPGVDKPYLITASYDNTAKVWDYRSKRRVRTMEGHANIVNFAVFHPNLPIIISGGQDGTVKIWSSDTYGIECTLNSRLGPARCIAIRKDTNEVAVGYDNGVITLKLDHRRPIFSMNDSGGLIYVHGHKFFSTDFQSLDTAIINSLDGMQIPLQIKDLDSTDISVSSILHSPDGRLVTIIGDGKYVINTALGWCSKSFGFGISFAWAQDSSTYVVLETQTKLKFYENFKEKCGGSFAMKGAENYLLDTLYAGPVLGARGFRCVLFWDWETGEIVGKIGIVDAKNISWSTVGTHVAIISDSTLYIYYFDRDTYQDMLSKHGPPSGDEGVPESFALLFTFHDTIHSVKWIGDCLIYTTSTRLCYSVISTQSSLAESELYTISPINKTLYLLGYIPSHEKVYVMDEDSKVYGYRFNFAVVEYQMAVLKGDMNATRELFKKVSREQIKDVVKFLENRGMKEAMVSRTANPELRRPEVELYKQCVALAMQLIATKPTNKLISELRDDKAQDMADFLSKMVDNDNTFTQHDRKRTLYLLSKLAKLAGVFPQSLELDGVKCNLAKPVTWGGYGLIFKGEHEGNPVCVKAVQINLEGNNKKKLNAHASELSIWAHLSHRNILPFIGIYSSEDEVPRVTVCMVSPWMHNGDLLQYLGKVPESPRKPLVQDVISGLQYLHDFDIIHADLKAKNILVSETGKAMLADFGISRLSITQTTTLTNVGMGTANWMAPELLLEDEPPSPNRQTDIWAFACTCYEIITGMVPFGKYINPPQLMGAFMRGKIVPLKPEEPGIGWDEDVWSVAARCWKRDPLTRPETHELFDIINGFDYPDDRSTDTESQRRRNYSEIDYDNILSILDEIRHSAAV